MNKSNKIIFSLLLFLTIPAFGMENDQEQTKKTDQQENVDQKEINPYRLVAKFGVGAKVGLIANYYLDYISVFIHEHAHGVASGYSDYTSIVYPFRSSVTEWSGFTACAPVDKALQKELTINGLSYLSSKNQIQMNKIEKLHISRLEKMSDARKIFLFMNGPIAGIFTTYLQCIGIEVLNGLIHDRPLKESLAKGIRFPFSFFSDAYKTGKKYCSYLLGKKIDENDKNIEEPTWSSVALSHLMFWRCASMIWESIYGFLPCERGDGQMAWNALLGKQCPAILSIGNLPKITLGIMCAPYIVGALQALISK